jgi:hypothetical protein
MHNIFKGNNSIILHNISQHHNSTIAHSHSIIKDLSETHHAKIFMGKEEEALEEEDLEEVEDQTCVITIRVYGAMKETTHNHLRHVCTIVIPQG